MMVLANVLRFVAVFRRLSPLSRLLTRAVDRSVANRIRYAVPEAELIRASKEIDRLCSRSSGAVLRR